MAFLFPHKTDDEYAETFNSYGRLFGFLPVYFNLQKYKGDWQMALSKEDRNDRPLMEEGRWVPRWLFRCIFLLACYSIIRRDFLLTGKSSVFPVTWVKWIDAVPFGAKPKDDDDYDQSDYGV